MNPAVKSLIERPITKSIVMLSAAEKRLTNALCSGTTKKEMQSLGQLPGPVNGAVLDSADITRGAFAAPALALRSRAKISSLGYLIYED